MKQTILLNTAKTILYLILFFLLLFFGGIFLLSETTIGTIIALVLLIWSAYIAETKLGQETFYRNQTFEEEVTEKISFDVRWNHLLSQVMNKIRKFYRLGRRSKTKFAKKFAKLRVKTLKKEGIS